MSWSCSKACTPKNSCGKSHRDQTQISQNFKTLTSVSQFKWHVSTTTNSLGSSFSPFLEPSPVTKTSLHPRRHPPPNLPLHHQTNRLPPMRRHNPHLNPEIRSRHPVRHPRRPRTRHRSPRHSSPRPDFPSRVALRPCRAHGPSSKYAR